MITLTSRELGRRVEKAEKGGVKAMKFVKWVMKREEANRGKKRKKGKKVGVGRKGE